MPVVTDPGTLAQRGADLVVVGSGAAGLTAALAAAARGARVIVVERADKIGGTSAVSGGAIWVPQNHHMAEVGESDSKEEALAYCLKLGGPTADPTLVETFVDTAPKVVRFLEDKTPLRFSVWAAPDYHAEIVGGKLKGRSLEPQPIPRSVLGEAEPFLRPAPIYSIPLTLEEIIGGGRLLRGAGLPLQLLEERMTKGMATMGQALVTGLLAGCLRLGVHVLLNARARRLLQEEGRVTGIRVQVGDKEWDLVGRLGVVLAAGGFEWNQELTSRFLPFPMQWPNSPPGNEGDALLMAMEVGADLANTHSVWGSPSAFIPGEEYEGHPLARQVGGERNLPHTIMVNRWGRRFADEGAPYNDLTKAMAEFDPTSYSYRNIPCWAIMDRQFRSRYPIMTVMPGDPDPEWLVRADSLPELAGKIGVDAERLVETVDRWNSFVAQGEDREFGRGKNPFARYSGDPDAPHPNLGTVAQPPFYALPVYPGALGTNGGPRVNQRGQVMHVRGHPIPGLYAAGNTIAAPLGGAYCGGGGTLAPAITFGYICGVTATERM